MICPKCEHQRTPTDDPSIPDYRCPACDIVYAKYKSPNSQSEGISSSIIENIRQAKLQMKSAEISTDDHSRHATRPSESVSYEDAVNTSEKVFNCMLDEKNNQQTNEESINTRKLLGLSGAIILFIGVFTPIIGNQNYITGGNWYGIIVLILAVISFILVLINNYKRLLFTGLGSLGVILYTFIRILGIISEQKSEIESKLAGNPFRGFADMAMQSIQLQWGWALLIVGAGLIIASAALKNNPQNKKAKLDETRQQYFLKQKFTLPSESENSNNNTLASLWKKYFVRHSYYSLGGFLVLIVLLVILMIPSKQIITNVIQTRNNIIYLPNSDEPFTGRYDVTNPLTGQKYAEINYKDGKQDGLATRWYENGQRKGEINYKNGKQNGLMTTWYETGQKESETNYKDEKEDGLASLFYENGQKLIEYNYKNGKQNGLMTKWYENGQKQSETNYKNGKKYGLQTVWDKNGQKLIEYNYKDEVGN